MINDPSKVETGSELNGIITAKEICLWLFCELTLAGVHSGGSVSGSCLNSVNRFLLML